MKLRLSKTRGRGTLKGYIALFVCMCTRAVHIELVEDYTSAAFIAAFHRFTSRRGHCKHLYNDQSTTFVGADSQLKQLFTESTTEFSSVLNSISNLSTEWHFNPPRWSSFRRSLGGCGQVDETPPAQNHRRTNFDLRCIIHSAL